MIRLSGIALAVVLVTAPAALAASAVDQYSEGIPTPGGQKPSRDAVKSAGSTKLGSAGTATIPPPARAALKGSKAGVAAEKAAKITAPGRPTSVASDPSSSGGGLGLFLPLMLAATLVAAIAIYLARRRAGATGGPAG